MPQWVWFLPIGAFTLVLGLWGFRMGWIAATITETEVINTYAHQYLSQHAREGAAGSSAITDCIAYPGTQRGVWIVVRCAPDAETDTAPYTYHVNRFGGLAYTGRPAPTSPPSGTTSRSPET